MKDIEILEYTGNDFVNGILEGELSKQDFDKELINPIDSEEETRRAKFIKRKYKHREFTNDIVFLEKMLKLLKEKQKKASKTRKAKSDDTVTKDSSADDVTLSSATTTSSSSRSQKQLRREEVGDLNLSLIHI